MKNWPETCCFDEVYYRSTHNICKDQGIEHFRSVGDKRGFDPSPYFSTKFYKEKYPDWAVDNAKTALGDCIARLLMGELRQPHPLIDLQWYKKRYSDLPEKWIDLFLHFVRHGDDELRSPSAQFDAGFYSKTYMEIGAAGALRHYQTQGKAKGNATRANPKTAQQTRATWGGHAKASSILIGAHDAQHAGVPLMAYDMGCSVRHSGQKPFFVLDRAGPLLKKLQTLGPVVIAAEGWDISALAEEFPRSAYAVIHSAEAAHLATAVAESGIATCLLVHEMRDYLVERDLLKQVAKAQQAGARIVASYPRLARALEVDFGAIDVVRPGLVAPRTKLERFKAVQQTLGKSWPVCIGAGQGSQRKGFDRFVEAAFALARRYEGATFVWLGTLEPWAVELAEDAQRRGLKLLLPGFVEDYLAWYRAADVYFLTSRQDPGPSTAFHAARMGVPYVAYQSDIAMVGEFGDALGVFVADGDVDAFVSAVEHYLCRDDYQTRRARRWYVAEHGSFDRYRTEIAQLTKQA